MTEAVIALYFIQCFGSITHPVILPSPPTPYLPIGPVGVGNDAGVMSDSNRVRTVGWR